MTAYEIDWDVGTENRYEPVSGRARLPHPARAFWTIVTARGCQIHGDPSECELPIQAAHILSKSSLKRHGWKDPVTLYDPRNGIGACYKAHRRSDGAIERFPVERFTPAFWEFAEEVGLVWLAERVYGVAA